MNARRQSIVLVFTCIIEPADCAVLRFSCEHNAVLVLSFPIPIATAPFLRTNHTFLLAVRAFLPNLKVACRHLSK